MEGKESFFVRICWQPCCLTPGLEFRPVALRPTLSSGLPFTTNTNIIALRQKKTKGIIDLRSTSSVAQKNGKFSPGNCSALGSQKSSRVVRTTLRSASPTGHYLFFIELIAKLHGRARSPRAPSMPLISQGRTVRR
jgi:hypothetical protein